MAKHRLAVVAFQMLVEANAGTGLAKTEARLAHLQRIAAQVAAVQLDQLAPPRNPIDEIDTAAASTAC